MSNPYQWHENQVREVIAGVWLRVAVDNIARVNLGENEDSKLGKERESKMWIWSEEKFLTLLREKKEAELESSH